MGKPERKTVRFQAADIPVIQHACGLVSKLLAKVKRDTKRLSLPTGSIESFITQVEEVGRVALRALGEEGRAPQETFSVDHHLTAPLRVGMFLYLDELEKIKGAQEKAGVESTGDTDARLNTVSRLSQKLSDQLTLLGPSGVNQIELKVVRAKREPAEPGAASSEALDEE